MDFQIAGHQTDGYKIDTEVYSGPLDLLLQLIEKAELDITRLALAQVTDQYLEYMHRLEVQDAAEVSAFLVIAAKLVQIKSAALLPRPVNPDLQVEEDPGETLARQLIIYKRFKELSKFLENREAEGLHTYLRLDTTANLQIPSRLDISELTLDALVQAAREIFSNPNNLPPLSEVVSIARFTIRQKISTILDTLKRTGKLTFRSLLSAKGDRVEIVVTFLAMLELVKRHMVGASQTALFGEIELQPEGEITTLEDEELEFID
ncbi:MAG: segregation/condensation protein A [Anaerolineaceae bacterium]|nr:segregation/condensation protein A [Anaerolineaceae bacterium]